MKYYINFWKQLKKKNTRNEKSFSTRCYFTHGLKGQPVTLKLKKIKEYNDLTHNCALTIISYEHAEPENMTTTRRYLYIT